MRGPAKDDTAAWPRFLDIMAGVPADPVIAYMLYNLAAASGHQNAINQRAAIARQMTQEQVEEAQALSRTWKVGTSLPTQSRTGGN
jgi:hypothetical protein